MMDRRVFIMTAALAMGAIGLRAPAPSVGRDGIRQVGWLAIQPLPSLQAEFQRGMQELGYVQGTDYAVRERFARGNVDQLSTLALELVRLKVDLIIAEAFVAIQAARRATTTIPIVFITGDPVASGFVQSLAHPGANLTGVSNLSLELYPKRIEVLKAAVPTLRRLATLAGPTARPDVLTKVIQDAVKA